MVWFILLGLVLLVVQGGLTGLLLTQQVGPRGQAGPRDDLPPPTPALGRARRALNNLYESLPIFLTLGVLIIVYEAENPVALTGAGLFIVGRVAHVIFYLAGAAPWRSIAFTVAMLGNLLMAGVLIYRLVTG